MMVGGKSRAIRKSGRKIMKILLRVITIFYKRYFSAAPARAMCVKVIITDSPCSIPQVFLLPLSAASLMAGMRNCRFGIVVTKIRISKRKADLFTKKHRAAAIPEFAKT